MAAHRFHKRYGTGLPVSLEASVGFQFRLLVDAKEIAVQIGIGKDHDMYSARLQGPWSLEAG
ncbi:hypothetical protein H1R20_g12794, partial [Candolleomyces eurysporus]